MTHTIQFKTVAEMILWLVDNDVDKIPADLTLHLGKTPIDKKVFYIVK